MNTAEKIIDALEKLLEEARMDERYSGDTWNSGFVAGVRNALSKAQAIAEGFQ